MEDYTYIDLSFTPEQLEAMLKNARSGGAVQVKVKLKLDIKVQSEIDEVILR